MSYKKKYKNLQGVSVYQEGPQKRKFVGELRYDLNTNQYVFTYSMTYLKDKKAIPLGPDLPLTQKTHVSSFLFASFLDRIPDKQNPAYASYCEQFGIEVEEDNPLILLSTIGRRGPSSFVFEPVFTSSFSGSDLKAWREHLGLSTRDFADAFGLSQANLVRIENEKASGVSVLPMMEIFHEFPQAGALYVEKHAHKLHQDKKMQLFNKLCSKTSKKKLSIKLRDFQQEKTFIFLQGRVLEMEQIINLLESIEKLPTSTGSLNIPLEKCRYIVNILYPSLTEYILVLYRSMFQNAEWEDGVKGSIDCKEYGFDKDEEKLHKDICAYVNQNIAHQDNAAQRQIKNNDPYYPRDAVFINDKGWLVTKLLKHTSRCLTNKIYKMKRAIEKAYHDKFCKPLHVSIPPHLGHVEK